MDPGSQNPKGFIFHMKKGLESGIFLKISRRKKSMKAQVWPGWCAFLTLPSLRLELGGPRKWPFILRQEVDWFLTE